MTLLERLPSLALKTDPAPRFRERRDLARSTVNELRAKLGDLQIQHDHALIAEVLGDTGAKQLASKLRGEIVATETRLGDEEKLLEQFDHAEWVVLRTSAEAQFDEIERQRVADRSAWFSALEESIPMVAALAQRLDAIGDVEDRDRRSRQAQEALTREYDLNRSSQQTIANAVPSGGIYFEGMVRSFQEAIAQAERNGLRPDKRRGR